ncbi:MAG: hypothetical protein NZ898_06610 [Myxococcota bacterium]|nr:hypothetical protein [Myxococcota bacterium]MDW8362426.1 hypothetical protein [Myxococcales bacterium]
MRRGRRRLLPVAVVAAGLLGCQDEVVVRNADAARPAPEGGLGDVDRTPDPACRGEGRWILAATGAVVSDDGHPVQNARVQLCVRTHPDERLICLPPPATDAEGRYEILVPPEARCMRRAVMRVLVSGAPYATTYCPVALDDVVDAVLVTRRPWVLFSLRPVDPLPPSDDPEAMQDVVLDGGLRLTLAPSMLGLGGDWSQWASRRIDLSAANAVRPCFADRVPGALVAWGLRPEASVDAPGARVRIEGGFGLGAGSPVELMLLGGLDTRLADGTVVEEAELATVWTGRVAADGRSINPSGSETGLTYLSWLVLRRAPPP